VASAAPPGRCRPRAHPRLGVRLGRDEPDDAAFVLGYEHALRVSRDIRLDLPGLPPAPVVAVDEAEAGFQVLVEADAVERLHGDPAQSIKIVGPIGSDVHARGRPRNHGLSFRQRYFTMWAR